MYRLPQKLNTIRLSPLQPKRGINEEYKSIINVLRKYSASSICNGIVTHINSPTGELPHELLQKLPWLFLLLAKWAIQDRLTHLYIGKSIDQEVLSMLVSRLWDLQDRQAITTNKDNDINISIMIRRMSYPQIEFQRNPSFSFIRWPALFNKAANGSRIKTRFKEQFKLSPEDLLIYP